MTANQTAWSLHERLKEDTIDIGDLPLSRVLVIKDANYPWLLLVPRRAGIVESGVAGTRGKPSVAPCVNSNPNRGEPT